MCGIIGAVTPAAAPDLSTALRTIAHRGPDGEGQLRRGPVWFGHRRLSIIDLTDAASQPMHIPGCGTLIFNGEIYDFRTHQRALEGAGERFSTHSDTEVLLRGLARYGVSFLRGLHGMYAFAWLDEAGKKLLLARDHAGMKPLYFWRGAQGWVFGSEVRGVAEAMRAIGASIRIDPSALADFMAWGSVPEPMTVLEGVTMLPADKALEIAVDEPERARWIDVQRRPMERSTGDEPSPLQEAIRAAVKRHLVADTPVALFLSGGVDSGVLAAEVGRFEGPKAHAITVALGSRGTSDEPEIARRMAARHGLPLTVIDVSDWQRRLDRAVESYDQPSVDGLNTYLISGVARELGYKVALSGVGADEVFGGYSHFHVPSAVRRGVQMLRTIARPLTRLLPSELDPRIRRAGLLLGAPTGEPLQRSFRRLFSEAEIARLAPALRVTDPGILPDDPLELEQATYLRDTLLRDTDVLGMANGVEIRAPFLDPEVLGRAASLGTRQLLDPRRPPKWVLRDGWRADLDPASLSRRKTGFTLDVALWLRNNDCERVEDALSVLKRSPLFDAHALQRAWRRWKPRLGEGHPAGWVPAFMLVQLAQQVTRWAA